jgi:short-subunit dehydrogenase
MNLTSFFANKVVVVTGGSDGIGKAIIEILLPLGTQIATCARTPSKLTELQSQFNNNNLLCCTADVSNENDCKAFIQSTIDRFGKIDVLINNAGISMRSLFADVDPNVIKKVMDINFMGTVYCTHFALPQIIKQKGTIVGISSIAGYRGLPGRSGYSASKFALNGWLEAIKTELKPLNVHVMWASPGFTKSNIRNTALNDKAEAQGESPLNEGALMTAETCANHILTAIMKKKRTAVLTFQGKQTIFINKFFPKLADWLVGRFFFQNGKLIK